MDKTKKTAPSPEPYVAPKLTTYGKLSELTRGTPGSGMDNGLQKTP